jgi:hypothetical protein
VGAICRKTEPGSLAVQHENHRLGNQSHAAKEPGRMLYTRAGRRDEKELEGLARASEVPLHRLQLTRTPPHAPSPACLLLLICLTSACPSFAPSEPRSNAPSATIASPRLGATYHSLLDRLLWSPAHPRCLPRLSDHLHAVTVIVGDRSLPSHPVLPRSPWPPRRPAVSAFRLLPVVPACLGLYSIDMYHRLLAV